VSRSTIWPRRAQQTHAAKLTNYRWPTLAQWMKLDTGRQCPVHCGYRWHKWLDCYHQFGVVTGIRHDWIRQTADFVRETTVVVVLFNWSLNPFIYFRKIEKYKTSNEGQHYSVLLYLKLSVYISKCPCERTKHRRQFTDVPENSVNYNLMMELGP